jgi:hypothetical protein
MSPVPSHREISRTSELSCKPRVSNSVSARSAFRAFGLGTLPCLVLSCVVMLLGWAAVAPVPLPTGRPTPDNLAKRAQLLRERLPGSFRVRVAGPFVLIAEASEADTERHAASVRRQVNHLRAHLFARGPDHIIDLWLFADNESYRTGTRALLEDWPRTLSGYYSPKRRAVIVNLESGEATLRHELVHPFMQASFPDAPAWVDEGVASLFERTRMTHRSIEPLPGRRLPRLQRTMLAGRLPSIAALTAGKESEFYGDPRRLSYAQARYAMMFLQGRGKLEAFLTSLKAQDPTGFDTLLEVTGFASAEELQVRWEAYVLSLEAPPSTPLPTVATNSKN